MSSDKGIEYEIQLLEKRIKSKENILPVLKANRFNPKTIKRFEEQLEALKGQKDYLFRLYQRGARK